MKPQKGLITRNTHVKYQSSSTHFSKVISKGKDFTKRVKLQGHIVKKSSTHCSKVISKVKVFKKNWVKLHSQGHSVKNNGTH